MFTNNWCIRCGKHTLIENVRTGLPGIQTKRCTICGLNCQANFLENNDDDVKIPDYAICLSKDFCSQCQTMGNFDKVKLNHNGRIFEGVKCRSCGFIFIKSNIDCSFISRIDDENYNFVLV
jgi:hypothetical protein